MRKILCWMAWLFFFIVLLAFGKAHGESWSMQNKDGGKIVITDKRCTNFTYLSEAYTYAADGTVIKSCWTVINGAVHVVYYNGSEKVYPITSFDPETSL
jgi:uncharacterized membrane protein